MVATMRKEYSVRVRIPEHQGHEIHQLALRENRSQSSAISILVSEALAARRAAEASTEELLRAGMESKLVNLIKGVASDFPATS
jgi:hypothetical protein